MKNSYNIAIQSRNEFDSRITKLIEQKQIWKLILILFHVTIEKQISTLFYNDKAIAAELWNLVLDLEKKFNRFFEYKKCFV